MHQKLLLLSELLVQRISLVVLHQAKVKIQVKLFKSLPQNNVTLMKTENYIQSFGKISSTISVLLMMRKLESSPVRMMEFIHFMQHQR